MARSKEQTAAMLNKKKVQRESTPEGKANARLVEKSFHYQTKVAKKHDKWMKHATAEEKEARRVGDAKAENFRRDVHNARMRALTESTGRLHHHLPSVMENKEQPLHVEKASMQEGIEKAKKQNEEEKKDIPRSVGEEAAREASEIIEKRKEAARKAMDENRAQREADMDKLIRSKNVDRGFYGHVVASDFKRTSIVSTTGRVR